jgi:hypothetical protein
MRAWKWSEARVLIPLPVLRERVRVISNVERFGTRNHPHLNPLPEYRERRQEVIPP